MSVALDVQIKQSHTNTTTPFAKPPKKDLSRRTPWDDADPETKQNEEQALDP